MGLNEALGSLETVLSFLFLGLFPRVEWNTGFLLRPLYGRPPAVTWLSPSIFLVLPYGSLVEWRYGDYFLNAKCQ